ncbi:MAG: hypothetical protein LVQ96_05345 [Thermoplasmatales archaeon]|nr:hypothetical protein [Thermoplasmatales archaeon]MCW6170577.1 hypothetical protein [Thermoplasmatales archaeon]
MKSTLKVILTIVVTIGVVAPLAYYVVADLSPTAPSLASFVPANSQAVVFSNVNGTPMYVFATPGNYSNSTGIVIGTSIDALMNKIQPSSANNSLSNNTTANKGLNSTESIINVTFYTKYNGYAIYYVSLNESYLNKLYNITPSSIFSIGLVNISELNVTTILSDRKIFVSQDSSNIITVGSLYSVEQSVNAHEKGKNFATGAKSYINPNANISIYINLSKAKITPLSINVFENTTELYVHSTNKTLISSIYNISNALSNKSLIKTMSHTNSTVNLVLNFGIGNYESYVLYFQDLYPKIAPGSQ